MAYCYAQINEDNVCIAVSKLSGIVELPSMIRLDTYDASVLGKKYNNGIWEEVPVPEPEPEPLSEQEQSVLETAINVDYLVCLADLGI